MDFWQGFLTITTIHLLAAAAPGPDFVLVSQHTLKYGRQAGLWCSAGIALGLSVHLIYSVLGLATVVANSTDLLWVIKLLGGSYLMYLGFQGIRSRAKPTTPIAAARVGQVAIAKSMSMGFACNALNPKAPIYFIALFTVVLSPDLPWYQLAIYGGWMMCLQWCWFAVVTLMLSLPVLNNRFQKMGHWIERVCGVAMIALGIKVWRS